MEFETRRVRVRKFKVSDIDDFMVYRNDLNWMRFQGFKGLSKAEYEEALLGDVSIEKGIQLAIVSKDNDKLIGDLYLQKNKDFYYLGFTITPRYARKGVIFEVVEALKEQIKNAGGRLIIATVKSDNVASKALLGKAGFIFNGEDRYLDEEFIFRL